MGFMGKEMSRQWLSCKVVLLAFSIAVIGCSKTNPVSEISLKQSGVAVVDRDTASTSKGWPAWRGPNGDGHAEDQPLLTHWDDLTNVVWRTNVPGRGHSSPVVVGNAVYLTTALEDKQIQQVIAFDRESGDLKWRTDLHSGGFPSKRSIHPKGTNANGTLACDGERLFIAFLNSDRIIASALDLNGEIIWQKEIGKFVSKFGYAPSPLLYKSLVIFAADNRGGGYLAAVDGATGEIAWRVSRENRDTYSSAAVANVGGRDQLLISGCDMLASYDPATGNENWKTRCLSEATCGTVVSSSDLIFASGGYPEKETVCLDADGNRVWENQTKIYEPSMVVVGDHLFAVTDDGIAYCWAAGTGDVIWKKRLGGNFSASPIVCNGLAYVPNLEGETFVFSTAGEEYQLIAKNELGNDCYASPAVADGQLFLRIGVGQGADRQEQLVCLSDVSAAESAQ